MEYISYIATRGGDRTVTITTSSGDESKRFRISRLQIEGNTSEDILTPLRSINGTITICSEVDGITPSDILPSGCKDSTITISDHFFGYVSNESRTQSLYFDGSSFDVKFYSPLAIADSVKISTNIDACSVYSIGTYIAAAAIAIGYEGKSVILPRTIHGNADTTDPHEPSLVDLINLRIPATAFYKKSDVEQTDDDYVYWESPSAADILEAIAKTFGFTWHDTVDGLVAVQNGCTEYTEYDIDRYQLSPSYDSTSGIIDCNINDGRIDATLSFVRGPRKISVTSEIDAVSEIIGATPSEDFPLDESVEGSDGNIYNIFGKATGGLRYSYGNMSYTRQYGEKQSTGFYHGAHPVTIFEDEGETTSTHEGFYINALRSSTSEHLIGTSDILISIPLSGVIHYISGGIRLKFKASVNQFDGVSGSDGSIRVGLKERYDSSLPTMHVVDLKDTEDCEVYFASMTKAAQYDIVFTISTLPSRFIFIHDISIEQVLHGDYQGLDSYYYTPSVDFRDNDFRRSMLSSAGQNGDEYNAEIPIVTFRNDARSANNTLLVPGNGLPCKCIRDSLFESDEDMTVEAHLLKVASQLLDHVHRYVDYKLPLGGLADIGSSLPIMSDTYELDGIIYRIMSYAIDYGNNTLTLHLFT